MKKKAKKAEGNSNIGLLFIGAGVLALGAFLFFDSSKLTKADAIKILTTLKPELNNSASITNLQSFGDDYVIAWATAVKNNKDTFIVAGKTYTTSTGRAA